MVSIDEIEMHLLLEAVYKRYGYDFRSYAKASLKRRIEEYLDESGVGSCCQLIEKTLHDESVFRSFLLKMTVGVTDMFRDPHFYIGFKESVVPLLKTYPTFKIWHAGCSTGEEVYSMAILLKEEDLLDRAVIYATDMNAKSLEIAERGCYEPERMKSFSKNYYAMNGKKDFSDYYHVRYDMAGMKSELKKNVTFSHHHLNMDGVFGQMNVILCRNVMIYFNRDLQEKVLNLFSDSLDHYGVLCIGAKETLSSMDAEADYKVLSQKDKIYQRVGL